MQCEYVFGKKKKTLERLKTEILTLNNDLSAQLFRENIQFAEKFI